MSVDNIMKLSEKETIPNLKEIINESLKINNIDSLI